MSTASAPYSQSHTDDPHERCTCRYCDDEYRHADGYNRRFCSAKCRYNGAAHGLLDTIRSDHRFCISCFRIRKTVSAPKPDTSPDDVKAKFADGDRWGTYHSDTRVGGRMGRQTTTDACEWGIGEAFDIADPMNDEWAAVPVGVDTTMVCKCGMSHHATVGYGARKSPDEVKNFRQNLSKSELNRRAARLCDVVTQLEAEGEHEWAFDREALFTKLESLKTHDDLCNAGADFDLLERALGHAIRQAEP